MTTVEINNEEKDTTLHTEQGEVQTATSGNTEGDSSEYIKGQEGGGTGSEGDGNGEGNKGQGNQNQGEGNEGEKDDGSDDGGLPSDEELSEQMANLAKAIKSARKSEKNKKEAASESGDSGESEEEAQSQKELADSMIKPGFVFSGSIQKKNFALLGDYIVEKLLPSNEISVRDLNTQESVNIFKYGINIDPFATIELMKRLFDQINSNNQDFDFDALKTKDKIKVLIESGQKNIWLYGPAGCGKTTMCAEYAKETETELLVISCGIGTSSVEFQGYKFPERESTDFAKFFAKKSVIVVDEFTVLDPAVAQILNAALANGYINTTTGTVFRHPENVIVCTSNTTGSGADRLYVSNNQLDASTIDRFVGGIIEVTYDADYENQFDKDVVKYVRMLRDEIKESSLRRVASTRMIIAGSALKRRGVRNWKERLIANWSAQEKTLVKKRDIDSQVKAAILSLSLKSRNDFSKFIKDVVIDFATPDKVFALNKEKEQFQLAA